MPNATVGSGFVAPSHDDPVIVALPGPFETDVEMNVDYTIRLLTSVQMGTGPRRLAASSSTLSPTISVVYGSYPDPGLATESVSGSSSNPQLGISSPALGASVDTGPTSPGALDVAPG